MDDVKVKVKLNRKRARSLKNTRVKSILHRAHENEIKLANPTEFFNKISQPIESKLYSWMKLVETNSEQMLDTIGESKIVEIDVVSGKWRWNKISTMAALKEMLKKNQNAYDTFMKIRENQIKRVMRQREDVFGGSGFSDDYGGSNTGAFPTRQEYTPLIGTPFYKQLYLSDYWEMHSKCFWYSNYSGIAKMIVDMKRNFVLGKGFSISFRKEGQKGQDAWKAYEDRSNIQEEIRNWHDDLTKFGENIIRKIPTANGIIHRSIDPSTIWEIVTDPENILDIKYYHQQYNTQYQLFTAAGAPSSKYVINQLPPQMMIHTKVNVTSYEKRGRSDLLAPLLYFKYFEDYMQAKLIRAKNEAAFIWDVSIDGSDEDVNDYIIGSQSMADVPPGSENVHNKAITRTPLSPQFGQVGSDQIAQDIMSYVAMSVSIPVTYFGTSFTTGSTKAGALVATEPVGKMMAERQMKIETLLRKIVRDVLIDAKLNPDDPKYKFEVNFPEIIEEDRAQKMQDVAFAKQEGAITHRRMSEMLVKELKINEYDYDDEQTEIEKESKDPRLTQIPEMPQDNQNQPDRSVDRAGTKKQDSNF